MKYWLQDHWYSILTVAILIGFGVVALVFSNNKGNNPEPSVNDYADSLVRAVFTEPYYEEYYFLAYDLEDLAVEYEGTPVGKELERLSERAENMGDWIKKIVKRAENLNNALPDGYGVW